MIESTTEISSLEGTSPRETASTSARRVPNTLIADYGREKKNRCENLKSRIAEIRFQCRLVKFHEIAKDGSFAVI